MTHFPAVKAQVYLLIVHTFHMLMLHLHPDVTKAHNNLSGQHISLSPFFFFSRVIKAFVICLGNQTRAAQEQRAAGPTLEGPRGWRGGWRPQGVGQPGVERETPQPYQDCASEGREEVWECFPVLLKV